MKPESIEIEKIVHGGHGLGYLPSGQVILVRNTLPDETVIVTSKEGKKNYLFGRVTEILKENPSRISPPCKFYGVCGGCDLQHSSYAGQLAIKKSILIDLISRGDQSIRHYVNSVKDVLPAPAPFNYRQRIRLKVDTRQRVGFNRYRSHDIVEIDRCLLASENLNNTFVQLRGLEQFEKLTQNAREIELQLNPASNTTILIFHFIRKIRAADKSAANELTKQLSLLEAVFIKGDDFPMQGPFTTDSTSRKTLLEITYTDPTAKNDMTLTWEAGSFCQVNLAQNKNLIDIVLDLAKVRKDETVLDLFCGMGNFSIPVSDLCKQVTGIEGQGSAIRSAKHNALLNNVSNADFYKNPVHQECSRLTNKSTKFDCVLIDPPRDGVPDLAKELAALTDKKLVYISCDPATLCRDLAALISEGFTITEIQPVDMFPQTHHIETVVLLEK